MTARGNRFSALRRKEFADQPLLNEMSYQWEHQPFWGKTMAVPRTPRFFHVNVGKVLHER
jgi:hypothetical protein